MKKEHLDSPNNNSINLIDDEISLDGTPISGQQVAGFLHKNPQFFMDHTNLLTTLSLPHPEKGIAVSLLERQNDLLRDKNKRVSDKLQQLLTIATNNDELNGRLHQLTLNLMGCQHFEELMFELENSLAHDFNVDLSTTWFFSADNTPQESVDTSNVSYIHRFSDEAVEVLKLVDSSKPTCGIFSNQHFRCLFGKLHSDIKSAALIPLTASGTGEDTGTMGLLALGSHQADRFHAKMDTSFLSRLGEIVSRRLTQVIHEDFEAISKRGNTA